MAVPFLVSAGDPAWIDGDPKLPFPQWGGLSLDVCE
jgi:hypothetical protein